jgi:drug/metabolite transporter (DMT)-like permease
MRSADLKSYLNLHLIVFIWGFTGVLGDLITIAGPSLVWYRMLLAGCFILVYLLVTGKKFVLPWKVILHLTFVGLLIAIHWILFFTAIKVSNVSITLAMFSMGAFFAAIFEPLFYNRKMLWYEVLFGVVIIGALCIIMQVEFRYLTGMIFALISVFFGVMFTLANGKLIHEHDPAVITLYEFFAGFLFVTVYLAITGAFTAGFFAVSSHFGLLLVWRAWLCTVFALSVSVKIITRLTPYTVMLTTNLEPVYGIVLAYFIIGENEHMSTSFYFGAAVIILTVILNGIIKHKTKE